MSDLMVEYSTSTCIEVIYGDSLADATYWAGYETLPVLAGFPSGRKREGIGYLALILKGVCYYSCCDHMD